MIPCLLPVFSRGGKLPGVRGLRSRAQQREVPSDTCGMTHLMNVCCDSPRSRPSLVGRQLSLVIRDLSEFLEQPPIIYTLQHIRSRVHKSATHTIPLRNLAQLGPSQMPTHPRGLKPPSHHTSQREKPSHLILAKAT